MDSLHYFRNTINSMFANNRLNLCLFISYSVSLYFSRNNGYAISTPTKDQYRGDGIGKFKYPYSKVLRL